MQKVHTKTTRNDINNGEGGDGGYRFGFVSFTNAVRSLVGRFRAAAVSFCHRAEPDFSEGKTEEKTHVLSAGKRK